MTADVLSAVDECSGWKFKRGRTDCCAFVAHVLKAITGTDYMDRFPKYTTKRQAERILINHGGWAGMLDSILTRVPFPARGDVVLMDDEIGICVGTAVACMTQEGIDYRPVHTVTGAWRG